MKVFSILNKLSNKCDVYVIKWWPWRGWPWPKERRKWEAVDVNASDEIRDYDRLRRVRGSSLEFDIL